MKNLTDSQCTKILRDIFEYTNTNLEFAKYAQLVSCVQDPIRRYLGDGVETKSVMQPMVILREWVEWEIEAENIRGDEFKEIEDEFPKYKNIVSFSNLYYQKSVAYKKVLQQIKRAEGQSK